MEKAKVVIAFFVSAFTSDVYSEVSQVPRS